MVHSKEYERLEEVIMYKLHPHIWTLKELQKQYNKRLGFYKQKSTKEIGNMLKSIKTIKKFKYYNSAEGISYIFVEKNNIFPK